MGAFVMTVLANCPSCRHVRQVQEHDICLGVMCPYCHNAYMDAVDRPRGDDTGTRPMVHRSSYDVDVGPWFAFAKAHWSSLALPAAGFVLLEGLALGLVVALGAALWFALHPIVGVVIALLAAVAVLPPFWGGMIHVTMAQLKGDPWRFADFFAAFRGRQLWAVFAFSAIMAGLSVVILMFVWIPVLIGLMHNPPMMPLVWIGVGLSVLFVPVWAYVMVRISFFGPYLILDRDFGPVEAVAESWDLTTGHFWGLLGVAVLLAAILVGGALLLGVGLLLLLPLTALVRSAGYLLAGGTRPPMKQPERA
jgi:hypothetical protein